MLGHETDFYAWSLDQARRIRGLAVPGLDCENIAEELERLGQSDRRELLSRTGVLLEQLLACQRHPGPTPARRATISEQRHAIRIMLEESPSLRSGFDALLAKAYGGQVRGLPARCNWSVEQILDEDWLPD